MINDVQFIPVTKAKAIFLDLVRKVKESDETVTITKNGVPEAVLMSVDKFQGYLETIEILSDENAMISIKKSIRDSNKGRWIDFEKVFRE